MSGVVGHTCRSTLTRCCAIPFRSALPSFLPLVVRLLSPPRRSLARSALARSLRVRLVFQAAELRLLILLQELNLLRTFETKDTALAGKLDKFQREKGEIVANISDTNARLSAKKAELEVRRRRRGGAARRATTNARPRRSSGRVAFFFFRSFVRSNERFFFFFFFFFFSLFLFLFQRAWIFD